MTILLFRIAASASLADDRPAKKPGHALPTQHSSSLPTQYDSISIRSGLVGSFAQ